MRFYILKNREDIASAVSLILESRAAEKENVRIALKAFEVKEEDVDLWGTEHTYSFTVKGIIFKDKRDTKIEGLLCKQGVYYPDKRSKKGKEIQKKLNQQVCITYYRTIEALGFELTKTGRFATPKLFELRNKNIVLKCDDSFDLDRDRFEEVTRTYIDDNLK